MGHIHFFFFLGGGGAIINFMGVLWGGDSLPSSCSDVCQVPSLKLTASLHLKIDGWNTRPSFLGIEEASFQGEVFSFRECISGVIKRDPFLGGISNLMLESMEEKLRDFPEQ